MGRGQALNLNGSIMAREPFYSKNPIRRVDQTSTRRAGIRLGQRRARIRLGRTLNHNGSKPGLRDLDIHVTVVHRTVRMSTTFPFWTLNLLKSCNCRPSDPSDEHHARILDVRPAEIV